MNKPHQSIATLGIIGTVLLLVVFCILQLVNTQNSPSLMEKSFTNVYATKRWGVGSGFCSDPKNAGPYLKLLQQYLSDPKYHSIVDLGCGDWQLMRTMTLPSSKIYEGYDVVKSIIEINKKNYQRSNVNFYFISGLGEFKTKSNDLLIVKDVLQHWPVHDIQYFLKNILPKFRYALITNDYTDTTKNWDINIGEYRPIDLEAKPFLFGNNLKVILDFPMKKGVVKRVYLYTNPNA